MKSRGNSVTDEEKQRKSEPNCEQSIVNEQTNVVVLLPRFLKEDETVRNDHADEY